jgi:adenine-specific DNA-methyltransferase
MEQVLDTHMAALPALEGIQEISLVDQVEALRRIATLEIDQNARAGMGQYMTPASVARLMASMFENLTGELHLLDAGAGVGSLTAAFVEEACNRKVRSTSITVTAYEPDPILAKHLEKTKAACRETCQHRGIRFAAQIVPEDFIERAVSLLREDFFAERNRPRFNRTILNPPYRKIHSDSQARKLLRSVGIETSNLYTAFVALAIKLLEDGGDLVAITPRSFCNGPYFKPFRQLLLDTMSLKHIHIFHARNKAFKDDAVLQENVIFHAVKARAADRILISSSTCAEDTRIERRVTLPRDVVNPNDPDRVIHIPTTEEEGNVALKARRLPCSLEDLGIEVSTGRVVDFRAEVYLRTKPGKSTAPLIYPGHFEDGFVAWPKLNGRKPNALVDSAATADLLVPSGTYVLVKRFTAKEERRRVVAAVYDPQRVKTKRVGFENHLNYYHINGDGVARNMAKGLALYLNSTLVDQYFRQFSGHTQVNATDLRSLRYPSIEQLKRLGKQVRKKLPDQARIDALIEAELSASP